MAATKKGKRKRSICNKKEGNEEIVEIEDWCFVCKDGGDLIICDNKNCSKVYHRLCVEKDGSELGSEKRWTCDWHVCYRCHRTAKFHCFCCPNAVCTRCVGSSEFALARGKKGFCSECLELILFAEANLDYDSDGNKVDFNDRNTYECLFKEYWEIIKENEGLDMHVVYAAKTKLENSMSHSHWIKSDDSDEDDDLYSGDSDVDSICEDKPQTKRKRFNEEFKGWASKPLISFLSSIGKDFSKSMTQSDVTSIIHEYIDRNISVPENKRKFIPDEKLSLIFGNKSISKCDIDTLLDSHMVQNVEDTMENSNEDDDEDSPMKKWGNVLTAYKEGKYLSLCKKSRPKKENFITWHSCYARINPDNVKLVYLWRSLVEELSKKPEIFEGKVVGSFVKIKKDHQTRSQRSSHHLVQVAGVKRAPDANKGCHQILLQVSFQSAEIPISVLSDSDFTEEECEDLVQKVESGLLQKLTVVELQEKARSLHEDITKHWIARELVSLQNRIDRANERGRRKEVTELLDRREQLKNPDVQERLLQKLPMVHAEVKTEEV